METLGALGSHGAVWWEGESSHEPKPDRIRGRINPRKPPQANKTQWIFPFQGLSAHSSPLQQSRWG